MAINSMLAAPKGSASRMRRGDRRDGVGQRHRAAGMAEPVLGADRADRCEGPRDRVRSRILDQRAGHLDRLDRPPVEGQQ